MPPWLVDPSPGPAADVQLGALTGRLIIALLLGCLVAGIYWATHRRDESLAKGFVATLVLLAVLIAMVTQVIGDNVARAFSLVGALSIVRFRTVVEDTRDTAFVILSVINGMAVGAGHLEVALIGSGVAGVAAALFRSRPPKGSNGAAGYWYLDVRIGIGQPHDELIQLVKATAIDMRLVETSTTKQGASIDLEYMLRLPAGVDPTTLLRDINLLEGVQSVELRAVPN